MFLARRKDFVCKSDMVSISRSPERSRFTDFGSPTIPMSVLWIAKGDIFDMVLFGSEINKNRVCGLDVKRRKGKIGMARRGAENREGSLGVPRGREARVYQR
ncbi:hypothetical protein TNCV_2801831, partial [Trichonephila clavipes]